MPQNLRKFKLESELCDVFMAEAAKLGWVAYPEVGTWDIVMVRKTPLDIPGVHPISGRYTL